MRIHLGQYAVVIGRIDDDGHIAVVFCRRTHHGWTADIDIFHRLLQCAVRARDSGGKRVQVDDYHVDRGDFMLLHDGIVLAATTENTAVNFRVQGFNASVHHFREAGVIGDFGDRQSGFAE